MKRIKDSVTEKDNSSNLLRKMSPKKIILPTLLGLAVVGYMLYKEFDPDEVSKISFNRMVVLFLSVSLLMMVIRDFGYMVRLRILTGNEVSWRQSFNIIMLWEFTSAITPSAIGGTAFAVYFIHKEGVTVGKSTSVVMATSFLDELYFVTMFPIAFFLFSGSELFSIGNEVIADGVLSFTNKYFYFAVIGFGAKFIWTCLIGYALFFNPESVKRLLLFIFRFRWIKRWRPGVEKMGDDMISSSVELKNKSFGFWLKAYLSTLFSWSSRYWIVNFLILALIFGMPLVDGGIVNINTPETTDPGKIILAGTIQNQGRDTINTYELSYSFTNRAPEKYVIKNQTIATGETSLFKHVLEYDYIENDSVELRLGLVNDIFDPNQSDNLRFSGIPPPDSIIEQKDFFAVPYHEVRTFRDHTQVFSRQLIMWIMMLVMPTPGGSGLAEAVFSEYMAEFIPGSSFDSIMALIWRLITYYPYLIIGAIFVPRWVRRIYKKRRRDLIT